MPSGLEFAHVIDVVAFDAATGDVVLIMTETRPWDGSDERLYQLQEKVNAYLSFALDGEMAETYPDAAAKPFRLRLKCASEPDPRTLRFIEVIRRQIAYQHIPFEVAVNAAGTASPSAFDPSR